MIKYTSIIFIIISTLMPSFKAAGQDKYNSLLWEISGNGLDKKSHLYGTMHVSNKIAFQLSDSFFEALDDADMVALESNPEQWIKEYKKLGVLRQLAELVPNYYSGGNYYNAMFKKTEINRKVLSYLFSYRNQMIDQILYRFRPGNENYSEETYLDMFIFQSAKKNEKPVYALENFEESYLLSLKGQQKDESEDYSRTYVDPGDMQEYYVARDLDKLDSLIENGYPKNYKKYMLDQRNVNMVASMDSLMKRGSLFSGIGAAHLPGNKGVISLLRAKGYTVKPVKYTASEKGRKTFNKWEDKVLRQPMQEVESNDGLYSLKATGDFNPSPQGYLMKKAGIWLNDQYVPDYANGSFYSTTRFATFPFLTDEVDYTSTQFLDSLLYLVVPGDIKEKEEISSGGFSGYQVTTRMANEQYMKFQAFVTPVEIIIFKVGGSKEYINAKNAKRFLKSIELTPQDKDSVFTTPKLDFEVNLPGYRYMLPLEDKGYLNFSGYSYDPDTDAYYLVRSMAKTAKKYIEVDSFELRYFVKEMTRGFEVDTFNFSLTEQTDVSMANFSFELNQSSYSGKILKKGLRYYMILTNASGDAKKEFINSFAFKKPELHYDYKIKKDSAYLYSSQIPENEYNDKASKLLKKNIKKIKSNALESAQDQEDDSHERKTKSKIIKNQYTGEAIYLQTIKVNRYERTNETLLTNKIKDIMQYNFGYSYKRYFDSTIVFALNDSIKNDSIISYSYTIQREGSSNLIQGNIWNYRDKYYALSTIRNANEKSAFYERFAKHFSPFDTIPSLKHSAPKDSLFLAHLLSEDSTEFAQASKSIFQFEPTDTSYVKKRFREIIRTYTFPYDNTETKTNLMAKYRFIENKEKAVSFLKNVIDSTKNESLKEEAIIDLLYTKTKLGFEAFGKNLTKEPLTVMLLEDDWNNALNDSLELNKYLLNALLKAGVDFPDTRENYLALYAQMIDSSVVEKTRFNQLKEDMITKTRRNIRKILLKEREIKEDKKRKDWKEEFEMSYGQDIYTYNEDEDVLSEVKEQMNFLIHWVKEDERIQNIFEKLADTEDETLKMQIFSIYLTHGLAPINTEFVQDKCGTEKGKYQIIRYLTNNLPEKHLKILDTFSMDTKDYLYQYALEESGQSYNNNDTKDSIAHNQTIDVRNLTDTTKVYIFEKWEDEKLASIIYFSDVSEHIKKFGLIRERSKNIYSYNKKPKETIVNTIIDKFKYSDRKRVSGYTTGSLIY